MTGREKIIKTINFEKYSGHVPHFELVFFLTMEVLGRVHPSHRSYHQWSQMSLAEKKAQVDDMASCHIDIAEKYKHDAIFVHPNPSSLQEIVMLLERIRERTGDKYFIWLYSDPTLSIPSGGNMTDFSVAMYEEPERLHEDSKRNFNHCAKFAEDLSKYPGLCDGFAMGSDYCFNINPFFSPAQFEEFIVPYLRDIIEIFHRFGFYALKHTDGNVNPIMEHMVSCKPDIIHSLDPQGGVSLAEIKKLYGKRVALMGNVNCGLLQTGSDEECAADIRRSLRDGMDGGTGYIFSTSNCVYTGMPLERYDMMYEIWQNEGIYK